MAFQTAEKKLAKLKIALTGPSGSGKTLSALYLASGLGKRIAVIDTENASASLYAGFKGVPSFDVSVIEPPYTIAKYAEAIKEAVDAKYEVLIIDSITHAWAGEGGLLSKKESLDARGTNSFSNWASITKEHEAFKSKLLNSDLHLIATMRSKQDYVLEINEKGKSAPRKVGLAPIQRDGMEYEFTTVFDIAMDHNFVVSKDRTGLFDGVIEKISRETGERLTGWLQGMNTKKDDELESLQAKAQEIFESLQEKDQAEKFLSANAFNKKALREFIEKAESKRVISNPAYDALNGAIENMISEGIPEVEILKELGIEGRSDLRNKNPQKLSAALGVLSELKRKYVKVAAKAKE